METNIYLKAHLHVILPSLEQLGLFQQEQESRHYTGLFCLYVCQNESWSITGIADTKGSISG